MDRGQKRFVAGLYARVSTHDQKTLPLQLSAMGLCKEKEQGRRRRNSRRGVWGNEGSAHIGVEIQHKGGPSLGGQPGAILRIWMKW